MGEKMEGGRDGREEDTYFHIQAESEKDDPMTT